MSRTDPKRLYVMLTSRNTKDARKGNISFSSRGEKGITGLKDFVDQSLIPTSYQDDTVVAEVDLPAASGRLLSVVLR